jgi:hypothetical protein
MPRQFQVDFSSYNLKKVLKELFHFIKDPLVKIKSIRFLNWSDIFVINLINIFICFSLGILLFSNHSDFNFISLITQFIFAVLLQVAGLLILSGLMYYTFYFTLKKLPFIKIAHILSLAIFHATIINTLSFYLPPISLMAFALSAILLIIAFSENFSLPKLVVAKIILPYYAMYIIFWIIQSIQNTI